MKNHTRREFLERAMVGAGAGLALSVLGPRALASAAQKGGRSYTAGRYAIEIDGINAGWLESVEGGHATSDVVNTKTGPGSLKQKHIGGVKYEDITVNCGTGMSKGFYEWIKAAFDGRSERKNGAIIAADFNYKELSRQEFTSAIISEIDLPAFDAGSKDAARMRIKFSPETIRWVKGTGTSSGRPNQARQKKWLPSNFRLEISGLDCRRVSRIEALSLKGAGGKRSVSNLVITLPESDAGVWNTWLKGAKGIKNANQKNGRLDCLAPDLREELFSLSFYNLGLFKLTPGPAKNKNVRLVKAEMYCEGIKFNYGSSALA